MSSTGSSNAAAVRRAVPKIAEAAAARARLSVVPRLRSRAPRVPFVTLVSVLLLAGVVGLLLFNTSMQQASFTATSLQEQADDLTARQEALAVDLENLRDPQNLAVRATRLGLVPPPAPSFLDLDSGAITGPLAAATREDALRITPPPPPGLTQPPPVEVPAETKVPSDDVTLSGEGQRSTQSEKNENKQRSGQQNKQDRGDGASRGQRERQGDDRGARR